MLKVLLVGHGAREHCIAETLHKNPDVKIYAFMKAKNPGILKLTTEYCIGSLTDFAALKRFVQHVKPDFAVIGPEDPLAAGIVDELEKWNIPSCAPHKKCAEIEASKSFARGLMAEYYPQANPAFKVFTSIKGVKEFIESLKNNVVVKADGLAGGKGVKVMGEHLQDSAEAVAYAKECLKQHKRVVIEEKLEGEEFSLMSFVDGKHLQHMVPVQDHKRAYKGDTGPQTGGMGSYSDATHSLPFLTEKDLEQAYAINEAAVKALNAKTGMPYKGILYGGFMATKSGVKLIEYNSRFGDPEVMNVLPILKTDFTAICLAIINGKLDQLQIRFEEKATVCKYVVPQGYPENPVKATIEVGKIPEHVLVYYASVDQQQDGSLLMTGSRAIAVVGVADTLGGAEQFAQQGVKQIKGPVFYREDIGTKELIQKRVDHMKKIRGKTER